jgi:hypothetical protein
VVDQEVLDSQLKTDRFPFPSEGDITLKVRNANYTLGPVMLHIGMKPGAVIPAHLHKGMAEPLYVVEGDFTNEGKQSQRLHPRNPKSGLAAWPSNGISSQSEAGEISPLRCAPRLACSKTLGSSMCTSLRDGTAQ